MDATEISDDDRLPKVTPPQSALFRRLWLLCTLRPQSSPLRFPFLQVPKTISVNRKDLFDLAAAELKLTMKAENTVQIDADTFMTTIQVGNMLNKESCERETKEFRGQLALAKNMAIQNAYDSALKYLDAEKLIKIDDCNADAVTRLKRDAFRSDSWAMLF